MTTSTHFRFLATLTFAAVCSSVSADDLTFAPSVIPASYTCTDTACGDCVGGSCDKKSSCGARCCEVCVPTLEKVKVENHCWCVECEKVCIPQVVCPWAPGGSGLTIFNCLKSSRGKACCGEACCADAGCGAGHSSSGCCRKPRCGEVITVRDLKKKTYECDDCACKWEIRRLPPCGSGCGRPVGCCD